MESNYLLDKFKQTGDACSLLAPWIEVVRHEGALSFQQARGKVKQALRKSVSRDTSDTPTVYFCLDTTTNRIVALDSGRDEKATSIGLEHIYEFYSSTRYDGDDHYSSVFCLDKQDNKLTLVEKLGGSAEGKELANLLGFLCNKPVWAICADEPILLFQPDEQSDVTSSARIPYLSTNLLIRLQCSDDKIIFRGYRRGFKSVSALLAFFLLKATALSLLIIGPLLLWHSFSSAAYFSFFGSPEHLMTKPMQSLALGLGALLWLTFWIIVLRFLQPPDEVADWIIEVEKSRLLASKAGHKRAVPLILALDEISRFNVANNGALTAQVGDGEIPLAKPLSLAASQWMAHTLNAVAAKGRVKRA